MGIYFFNGVWVNKSEDALIWFLSEQEEPVLFAVGTWHTTPNYVLRTTYHLIIK